MLALSSPPIGVATTVHYTARIPDDLKHGEWVGWPFDPTLADRSLPQLVDARVPRKVLLRSARTKDFSIRRHGFELRHWPTQVRNFDDSSAVLRDYVPEVEALVSHALESSGARGIRAIVVWDLCLRSSELVNEFQQGAVQAASEQAAGRALDRLAPVPLAHADFYSARDVYRRLRQRWTTPTDTLSTYMDVRGAFASKGLSQGADLERCLASRVVSVNVWRSIDFHHPVRRCPLALCDPGSLTAPADELVPFEICCPDVSFAEAHVLADGREGSHRWVHYPRMCHDECLLFVSGDTAGRWAAAPHTSVDDPRTTASDPPRTSIEARVFVIFDS